METRDNFHWLCRWTVEKRHEDIDAFTGRKARWAKTIQALQSARVVGRVARAVYDQTIGVKERDFYRLFAPYEVIEGRDNCALNAGIAELEDLLIGAVDGASHIYDNAHAKIGVGDSATAAAAAQTDLQAATNKQYNVMEATFPSRSGQVLSFKASFATGEANWVWNEWVIKHSVSAICLNRKVEALGTKPAGTWTLTVTITIA